ncbi:MAG: cysteine desulfurase [Candidatus Woesearchaeota archaeon]|nr:MAG: cysteine desulfurase [Candidatus Woesearchaeota archaeon]
MNVKKIREDFPILNSKKPIIYFDNACMSLKPRQVIEKINEYYNEYPACVGRSNHRIGRIASEEYNNTRSIIKKFINAREEKEIIFTRNTTEGLNILSKTLDYDLIITTDKEHNSNHVPWLMSGKKREILKTEQDKVDTSIEEQLKDILAKNKNNKILISIVHTSNLDGTTINPEKIIKIAHENNALVVLDAAQSITHKQINVKKLDVDFIAFSGHKILGPTGTGVLYGKKELLEKLKNNYTGGDTVKDTFYDKVEFEEIPQKFEAGLQDYAGFIGLGEAIKYLQKYINDIESHQTKLNKILTEGLKEHVKIIGPKNPELRSGIFNFTSKINHHELSVILDNYANIMIRSGRHCVHSWYNDHNIEGSARASVYLYNTEEEAKTFVDKMKEILK